MIVSRRMTIGLTGAAALAAAMPLAAQTADMWSAKRAHDALEAGQIVLVDIRSPGEWQQTGVARGAWPISLHEDGFAQRLFAAKALAGDKPVALICATGGRTASVMGALNRAGYTGFVDVSEGMMGSDRGPGWIASGLPVVSAEEALAALPEGL